MTERIKPTGHRTRDCFRKLKHAIRGDDDVKITKRDRERARLFLRVEITRENT